MQLPSYIHAVNISWKINLFQRYFSSHHITSVLDFGSGDMVFTDALHKRFPRVQMTGVDLADFVPPIGITYKKYKGTTLPFSNRTYDVVIALNVLHHCQAPETSIHECLRVAKKRVFIVEPVPRYHGEEKIMGVIDRLFNMWKSEMVPMPEMYRSKKEWIQLIEAAHGIVKDVKIVPSLLPIIPVGQTVIFEVAP